MAANIITTALIGHLVMQRRDDTPTTESGREFWRSRGTLKMGGFFGRWYVIDVSLLPKVAGDDKRDKTIDQLLRDANEIDIEAFRTGLLPQLAYAGYEPIVVYTRRGEYARVG